jgi:hypothetical protein
MGTIEMTCRTRALEHASRTILSSLAASYKKLLPKKSFGQLSEPWL